jgi:hypothetical protein
MNDILRGYEPENKRLTRLKNKARLQLVLNKTITPDVTEAIRDVITCKYCKYRKESQIFAGEETWACRRVGIKNKKYALLNTGLAGKKKIIPVMQLLYCCQFTEIPED